jgi:PAS domain S-box-containing protein
MNSQPTVGNSQYESRIKALQAEMDQYKTLTDNQKLLLEESQRIIADANQIKTIARIYADSLIASAYFKSQEIKKSKNVSDTNIIAAAVNYSTRAISKDEFEMLSVKESDFENKKSIIDVKKKIQSIVDRPVKTAKDSLEYKKNNLQLRQELFDLAKFQLQIDRLNAKTKEDSMAIDRREANLNAMEKEMALAKQEIEIANNMLALKDLEIRSKNIMLVSVGIGLILLLFLLGYIYYNYMDKKRINKILEYQNQELEKLSIVASETSNAIVITDKIGQYTWVNKGYTRLFGYDLNEVCGDNPISIINEDNKAEINELIRKSIDIGESVNFENETLAKSGEKIWIQTTISPIFDKQGAVSKLVAIDSDISKIKEAEQEILKQSRLLAMQNAQIMDSINYAKRIQDAILPSGDLIKLHFPDSFIYFKPRDIVSGDFYWFSVQNNKLFLATVDCTGHGVPGAFMSLIGNSLLNHIVNEKKIYKPSEILKELNNGVHKALSQSQSENEEREDGMDISICQFDKTSNELQIACANHTVLFMRKDGIEEVEGDEISIGDSFSKGESLEFTNHTLNIEENTIMYLFSDGYPDQIGGPKNKKFLVDNFKKFLSDNKNEAMSLQFDKLNESFKFWKGVNKQTDDILIMGIRFNVNN